MKILLVEPEFPIPNKSKNHKNFLPIGLLKLGAFHKDKGNRVKLIRGNKDKLQISRNGNGRWFIPDKILITSLFTYWKEYVQNCIEHYRFSIFPEEKYPNIEIVVGGIYASLMTEDCEAIPGIDKVVSGVLEEAEKFLPDYSLIEENPNPLDYQIIHTSRGCTRKCDFCGTHIIEHDWLPEKSVKNKLVDGKNKIVFYDNNLLRNPNIENILKELIDLKKERRISWCESQSGFDGRLLLKNPDWAKMVKKAGFRYPRIAWDNRFQGFWSIKRQIDILTNAGYNNKDLSIFMIYNWEIPFEEMEQKRLKCWEWKVQIADCRFRPLYKTKDDYNSHAYRKGQTSKDYHIHMESGWTDHLVRQFRKNVRRQNICVRQEVSWYSPSCERKRISKEETLRYKIMKFQEVIKYLDDAWDPGVIHKND